MREMALRLTAFRRGAGAVTFTIGKNPFNRFSLSFEVYARNQPEGRLQIFASASPGHNLHVSPNVGALRDGIALGVRMEFRA